MFRGILSRKKLKNMYRKLIFHFTPTLIGEEAYWRKGFEFRGVGVTVLAKGSEALWSRGGMDGEKE